MPLFNITEKIENTTSAFMKNQKELYKELNLEQRLERLEKDSHPPVDWQELIYANIERIDKLEMDNNDLIGIIKHLSSDNRDLKKRIDILEEILSNWLPVIGEDKE